MYYFNGILGEVDDVACHTGVGDATWPVLICLLGGFRVLKGGRPVPLHGSKAEVLLRCLGLHHQQPVARDLLLETMWPSHALDLAGQSLNSLMYSLRKSLGDHVGGDAPVLHEDGYYRLNWEAGVGVDVACFESLIKAGDKCVLTNQLSTAVSFYVQATEFYRGDLCAGADINSMIARERLRVHFLTVLARLADYYFLVKEYGRCLQRT